MFKEFSQQTEKAYPVYPDAIIEQTRELLIDVVKIDPDDAAKWLKRHIAVHDTQKVS